MKDPVRLLEGKDELVVELIEAWQGEQPSSRIMGETAIALGVAAGAMPATTALAAASAVKTAAPSVAAGIGKMLVASLSVGFIAGVGVVGGIQMTRSLMEGSAPARTISAPRPGPAWSEADRVPATPRALDEPPTSASPAAFGSRLPAERRVGAPAASTAEPRSLADAIAAIDQARQALDANQPQRALSILDECESRRTSGVFKPETTVLRIEALQRLGRDAEATALARRFVQDYPRNPHSVRLRDRLLHDSQTK